MPRKNWGNSSTLKLANLTLPVFLPRQYRVPQGEHRGRPFGGGFPDKSAARDVATNTPC